MFVIDNSIRWKDREKSKTLKKQIEKINCCQIENKNHMNNE